MTVDGHSVLARWRPRLVIGLVMARWFSYFTIEYWWRERKEVQLYEKVRSNRRWKSAWWNGARLRFARPWAAKLLGEVAELFVRRRWRDGRGGAMCHRAALW